MSHDTLRSLSGLMLKGLSQSILLAEHFLPRTHGLNGGLHVEAFFCKFCDDCTATRHHFWTANGAYWRQTLDVLGFHARGQPHATLEVSS